MSDHKLKIALFNDTGNYPHIGCRAVSDSHDSSFESMGIDVVYRHFVNEFTELGGGTPESSRRKILDSPLFDEISSVDAIVVNGEGTIHHGHGLHLLLIISFAQEIGKPTYLLNAVIQEVPNSFLKVLVGLRDLAVRDLFSFQYMTAMGVKCRLVADSILGAKFDEGVENSFSNKILITDCVVSARNTNNKLHEVAEYFGVEAAYFPLEGQNALDWQGVLRKFRGCRLIVTGRHHGLYLALMAKVPFVALPSNTWKIEGTLAALEYGDNLWGLNNRLDVLDMCKSALENASVFEKICSHPFIKSPLSTFDVLAKDFGRSPVGLTVETAHSQSTDCFYANRWNFHWQKNLGLETTSADQKSIANQVLLAFGIGRALDVGSGAGQLVSSLLQAGVDVHGVDISKVVTDHCNINFPGRFTNASILALPFADASFHTVVSVHCLEHLAPQDIPGALKEMHRVSGRCVYLKIAVTPNQSDCWHLTVEGRSWWETKCFEAGFRKHPAYYKINPYESLSEDGWQITIFLEKIPEQANMKYPIAALAAERDLHMDMLREVGERSDARVARYLWVEKFVRQGDRVLDAASGLGYGSYCLAELSKARAITGIDGSDYAIDYARENFCPLTPKLDFFAGYLPECLQRYPDGHFDVIVSFETLEHVEHPEALLKEFHRLLSPGGRIIVSVPNDWSDETGEDPNPFHLHVYTLDKLRAQIKQHFIPEALVQQIASGCKTTSAWNSWQRMPRTLRNVAINTDSPPPSEWWLMVGMKDPVVHSLPYRESVYGYSAPPDNLLQFECDYKNPWLVRSLLEFHFRAIDKGVLSQIAYRVLGQDKDAISADKGAALAVLGYQLLTDDQAASTDVERFIVDIEPYATIPLQTPHLQRFHVSLAYLKARLLVKIGKFDAALPVLRQVANADLSIFSPTLGTKVVDAAFEAGMLDAGKGDISAARASWKLGVERAYALLSSDVKEFVGDISHPHEFPTIVAVEFLDSAVRCIKALRITAEDSLVPLTRLYELTRENWKGMLEERWAAMQSMEGLIRERDEAIAGQARMLEERWAAMQSMEGLIRERDEAIAGQARMLEERWAAMQSMEGLIRERDDAIAGQARMLEERWAVMQSMEGLIRERDETIIEQRRLLEKRPTMTEAMRALFFAVKASLQHRIRRALGKT